MRSTYVDLRGLARDKRRQKYAGLRLRRLSRKGAFLEALSCTSLGQNTVVLPEKEMAREPVELVPCNRAMSRVALCSMDS